MGVRNGEKGERLKTLNHEETGHHIISSNGEKTGGDPEKRKNRRHMKKDGAKIIWRGWKRKKRKQVHPEIMRSHCIMNNLTTLMQSPSAPVCVCICEGSVDGEMTAPTGQVLNSHF